MIGAHGRDVATAGPAGAAWTRVPWRTVAAACVVLVLGALVVLQPALALLLAGSGALVGVLAGVARIPAAVLLVVGTLMVVGLVDLPRRFVVGPTTSYAWITVVLALLLVAFSLTQYTLSAVRGGGRVFVLLYTFGAWALLSLAWSGLSLEGIQNTLVYTAFAALVPVTAAAVIHGDLSLPTARRAVTYSIALASALFALSLAAGGLGASDVIGARSYALVGVIGVAWGAAHARFGSRRLGLLAVICSALILLSLSRAAFGAAILVLVVASLDLRTPARFVRSTLAVGALAALTYAAVTSFGPLAERFQQGDLYSVGGVSVNVTGRAYLWDVVWESYVDSPAIGKGAGSAQKALQLRSPDLSQPHNDFLRVLHDFGAVGFALLVASLVSLLAHSARATKTARGDADTAPIHLASGLAVLGLVAAMITDNAIVYLFVVAPVAIMLGLSLGLVQRPRSASEPVAPSAS